MRWALAAAALAALVALAALGAGAWLLYTDSGLRWAAARAEAALEGRLRFEGLRGALARDIRAAKIQYRDPQTRVEIRDVDLQLELLSILGGRAGMRSFHAEALEVALDEAVERPRERRALELPLGLRVEHARIELVALERGPQRYVLEGVELRDAAVLQTGAVSGTAGFALRHERFPARGTLKVSGTLERLEVGFSGRIAEVPVDARAVVAPGARRPLDAIDVQLGPLDLARLDPGWPRTALSVKLSGRATAGQALAGSLSARNAAPGPLDEERIPLVSLEARFASVDLASVSLQDLKATAAPRGAIAGGGTLRPDRADLDLRVSDLDLKAFGSKLHSTRLSGQVRVGSASAQSQSLQGVLSQDGMRIEADIVRDGQSVQARSLRVEAHGGAASGTARVQLGEPMRFEARLDLAHFDPARFGAYPGGDINGTVEASGALGADPAVDARWVVERSTLEGEPLESRGAARLSRTRATRVVAQASFGGARLTARGDFGRPGDELGWAIEVPRLESFFAELEGGLQASGTLKGTLDEPQAALSARADALVFRGVALKSAAVKASGSLERHTAQVSARAEGVDLEARLSGGWSKAAGWSGELQALRNAGRYPLQLRAAVPLHVAPGRVKLGRFDATVGAGRVRITQLQWADQRLQSSGEFSELPAQWLILAAGLTERVRSTLLLDGEWTMASTPRLTGTASVRRSGGDLTLIENGELALGLKGAQVAARFADGAIQANADVSAKYADAKVMAEITPVPGAPGLGITPQSALAFDARIGGVDLRAVAQPLVADARIEGRLAAELRGKGTLAEPVIRGTVRGDAIAFEMPPLGVFLRNGQLRAALEGDTLRVTDFSIQGGDGRFTATGVLPLRLANGGAKLAWRAETFGLLQRPDLRLVVSGSGEAQVLDKRVALSGSLRADRGYLELEQERLPRLGDDVVVIGREHPQPRDRPTRVPVALDLQLDLGEDLEVRGYGLEGKLAGNLQIETTAEGELRAYGRIRTVNATFLAYGQRLQVDPGIAIFDGPLDNPSLQLTAWRRNQQVEVGVQVTGNVRAPRVQLVSQPPVPESERLSWLVLGRAPTDATKADLGLLQAAAGALLARGDRMPLDRRIAQAFGLDEISLRGSGEVADRVFAVGKRLSDRLYVSYEQGLGTAASALVKLDFSLTQRLAVRAETGTASGVGLFYRFSWD